MAKPRRKVSADTHVASGAKPVAAEPFAGIDSAALDALVECAGRGRWARRIGDIAARCVTSRSGRAIQQRHAVELTIERLRGRPNRPPSAAELRIAALSRLLMIEHGRLTEGGRLRLERRLAAALTDSETLVPLLHLVSCVGRNRGLGFEVAALGLEDEAPFDLLLARDGREAEVVCDVISAETGRGVHRSAWFSLADRIDPDLQTWLAMHPGRYLLKMTLPKGLDTEDAGALGSLHDRIRTMLDASRRADHDEAAVLRLDPLVVAASQADELGLLPSLRRHFGPEAHLSVTASGKAVFVMAARAGQANDVAAAVRRRMQALAPARLTGTRPGILAMFVEDADRTEWLGLRDELQLERETRQFLTFPEARHVAAVTCMSRLELLGMAEGELRFRNPSHPDAKVAALLPAIESEV